MKENDARGASNYLGILKTDIASVVTTDTIHILHHELLDSLSVSKGLIDDGMSGDCFVGRRLGAGF